MKHFIYFSTMLFMLSGCGGGSSSGGDSSTPSGNPTEITMEIDTPYTVYSGDSIVKTSSPAFVKIYHTDGSSESTVTLIEGSATIIRK